MLPRVPTIVFAAGLALTAVAGCTPVAVDPPEPTTSATPEAEATALWSDDDEALDLAVAAYEAYLTMAGEIAADGGADPERIEPFVTPDRYAVELDGYAQLAADGQRIVGRTSVSGAELRDRDDDRVEFIACWDRSESRVIYRDGSSTSGGIAPGIVTVVRVGDALRLDSREPWDDSSRCSR
jgi:hypothetical protein